MSEMQPPEGGQVPGVLPASGGMPGPTPPPAGKKFYVWYFILGFVTPALMAALTAGAGTLLYRFDAGGSATALAPLALQGFSLAVFAGILVAFVMGRSKGNDRLRSFGLGGLIAYGVALLLSLLVFGACLVTLGGGNLFGGGN